MTELTLAHGLGLTDLYQADGLARIDDLFRAHLATADGALAGRLEAGRAQPAALDAKGESELLIALAPHLEDFIAGLFGIRAEVTALAQRHHELAPLYACKRLFVQRRAQRAHKPEEAAGFDAAALEQALATRFGEPFSELAFARHVMAWLDDETANAESLDLATRYAAWALLTEVGRARHHGGVLFRAPHKVDPQHLLPLEIVERHGAPMIQLPESHLRRREGFDLTDRGM